MDLFQLPGDIHQVSPVLAHDVAVKSGAFGQVFLWISIFELLSIKAINEMYEGSGREPGDYGFDPLMLSEGKSDEVKNDFAVKELKNGRLAMMAFSGIVTQAVLTGKGFLLRKSINAFTVRVLVVVVLEGRRNEEDWRKEFSLYAFANSHNSTRLLQT